VTKGRSAIAVFSIALLMLLTTFVMNTDHGGTIEQNRLAARVLADTPPYAVIVASATDVANGSLVHFDGMTSNGGWGIVSCTWNYTTGSGTVYSFEWTVDIVFDHVGNFTVTLTVLDPAGLTGATAVVIHVRAVSGVNNPPVAEAGPDSYRPIQWNQRFDGLGSTDDQGIASYVWDFSEDGIAVNLSGPVADYTFTTAGTYVITLTVTDVCGLTASDTTIEYVWGTEWVQSQAEAGPDQTVKAGEEATFDGSGSTGGVLIVNYSWILIDGGVIQLYGIKATHTFLTPGDYMVTLAASDSLFLTSYDTLKVHVLAPTNNPPHAEAGSNATIQSGTTFQFNGSGSTDDEPGLDYLWNFIHKGTHVIIQGVNPAFQFTKVGTYVVNLTVTDAGGLSDSDTVAITVTNSVDTSNASFLETYGVWLLIGGAEAALVALAALVVMKLRSSRKT